MESNRHPVVRGEKALETVLTDEPQGLTERQWAILRLLVSAARGESFDAAEPFLAVRVGLSGIAIHHCSIEPIPSAEMADIDHLAELGFVHIRRLFSGARSIMLTCEGFRRADLGWCR
jgi:hypothetical protein